MKQILAPLMMAATLNACTTAEPVLGGDRDAHSCIGSAGQSWSVLKQQCVQPWEAADLKLDDPTNDTLAVYVVLSADKAQAEVFAADVPENTVLDAVKGGYVSLDGKVRLLNENGQWRMVK